MPDSKDIPTLRQRQSQIDHPLLGTIRLPSIDTFESMHDRLNDRFYHELAEYEFVRRLFREVRLVVTNTGEVPATDVRIEIAVPTDIGIVVIDPSDVPQIPERRTSLLVSRPLDNFKIRPALRHAGYVDIDRNDHRFLIEVDCASLQPGRRVWSDSFLIGIGNKGETVIEGRLFASNLPKPVDFSLTISADVSRRAMTVDELLSLGKPTRDKN